LAIHPRQEKLMRDEVFQIFIIIVQDGLINSNLSIQMSSSSDTRDSRLP